MSILRKTAGLVYTRVTDWSLKGGPRRRAAYYRFLDLNFGREQSAVGAGIAEYNRRIGTGKELYLLRRNVHRLEKALTMRPRRDSFALGYIEESIQSYVAVVQSPDNSEWRASEEAKWVTAVLTEYFEATQASNNPTLHNLEARFQNATISTSELFAPNHGPSTPTNDPVAVSYNDLLTLATQRRSIRWYEDRPVERTLVDNAVRIAQESPTACNRQPYKFYIFDDRESVDTVAKIPMGTAGFGHQIPGLIVVVGDLSAFANARDRHLIYVDGCLATMGLVYGLESQGLASCTINWPDMRSREIAMKNLLGLNDYERVIMLVSYGYADSTGLTPFSAKQPIDVAREYRTLTT